MNKSILNALKDAKTLPLDWLIPLQEDLKTITEENKNKLKKSILKHGFSYPIFVWEDEQENKIYILDGHQRRIVMEEFKEEGYSIPQLPVVFIPADDIQDAKQKLLSAASYFGEFNQQGVVDFTAGFDFDLDSINIPFIEFAPINMESETTTVAEHERKINAVAGEDIIPEVSESKVRLGDIFILGDHKLICDDSTERDSVDKIMVGELADFVFTDPPYGVNFKSNQSDRFEVLKNDDKILPISDVVLEFMKNDSAAIVWTSQQVYPTWREQFQKSYKSTIIWSKGGGGMGDLMGDFAPNYEMALFCTKGRPSFIGPRPMAVWNVSKDAGADYLHPTQKPVALAEFGIKVLCPDNGIVLDLFGGSGSTLIACEKSGTRCRMVELDELYCAIIIERWQDFTGKKAYRLNPDGSQAEWNEIKNIKIKKKA